MINSKVLLDLSEILTKHKIEWAVGGSYLLYLYGLYDSPNDIDIWVQPHDIEKVKEIFSEYQEIKVALQLPEKDHYKMKFEDCEVDFISWFYVVPNQKDFSFRIDTTQIHFKKVNDTLSVPCLNLEEWYIIYKLLNKKSKADILEKYFQNNPQVINEAVLQQSINNNTLQKRVKKDVSKLIDLKDKTTIDFGDSVPISPPLFSKPKLLEKHKKVSKNEPLYEQLCLFENHSDSTIAINDNYPPLRLVVNSNCNGKCPFCHHEGNTKSNKMSIATIVEIAKTANSIGIPIIAITGGEPTLRNDLGKIIEIINGYAPYAKIHLTTNGKNLSHLIPTIPCTIDTLNLSISSFSSDIAQKYQNVDIKDALKGLMEFPAINKNLNIVITNDNYLEIEKFIDYCISNKISLTLMFELKEYQSTDLIIQQKVFDYLSSLAVFPQIVMKIPPVIEIKVSENTIVYIKHPELNRLTEIGFCSNCKSQCFERLCAVRVLPDGTVSPCLNQTIKSSKRSTNDKIRDIYSRINTEYSLFSFLSKKT